MWVQGGGIEIPCSYEIVIRKDEIQLKNDPKVNISALKEKRKMERYDLRTFSVSALALSSTVNY